MRSTGGGASPARPLPFAPAAVPALPVPNHVGSGMAGGAAGEAQCLSYTGCNFLRQRLVLATLSGRPLKIRKIRAKEEDPGLRGERRHWRPRGRRSGGGGAPAVPGTCCRAGADPHRELGQPGLHLGGPHQNWGPSCVPVSSRGCTLP